MIDLEPYLLAVEDDLAPLELLPDVPPSAIYLTADHKYDHVLYPCNRSNVYLVVVVSVADGDVYGHFVLDLQPESSVSR